ncbi:GNAT family N-acetyltransferase [Halobacteriales archaeon QS_8_69_26]|nr:MAG: GNAT family N-acetyltransferase [Halobacteriales archaeon QS_8_69_26]
MTGDRTRVYPDEPAGPFEAPPRTVEDRADRTVEFRAVDEDRTEDLVAMYRAFDPSDRAQGIPPVGEERIREWVEQLLDEGVNVVARHDGGTVGHATLVPDAPTDADSHELAIFVLGDYQGAGIGTELLRTLLGEGARQGVDRVWLTVEPWNKPAIRVYEKVGFEPSGNDRFEREYSIRLA